MHGLGWVSASHLEGELIFAGLRGAAAAPARWPGNGPSEAAGCCLVQVAETPPSAAGRGHAARHRPGPASENASALGLLCREPGKSCVNRGRITKNEPLQL